MDADTTTQHKTSSDGSPSEEVTTTNNENSVTVCSDNENGNFEAEVLEKETKFPCERSELMKQTEKQLEIVIMEESLNEDDLHPAPISNKVCEQTKEEDEVDKQPETFINKCENKTNEQTEAEDLLEDALEATTTTEREDDTQASPGDFKMDEGTAESPASRQNIEGLESSEEVGDSDQEEEMEEEEEEEEEEEDEMRKEANIPMRRKGRTKKGPLNPDAPKDGKVEKILQMRYKRSIKHYHVQWVGMDSSHNSWLILDPSIAGFMEQVAVYDERRKKANDRGEGSSSKKTSRTKHSWYYLSSSEDEDSILKDNFWKNLDEGKLNLYQSPSDMYSTLKEVGRSSKSYNQEVRAAIPEDYLAETKRVTRSRVLTPVVKKSKALSKVRKVAESDSTETMSSEKKDKPTGKRKPQKTPSKTTKKEPAKKMAAKKPKTVKKKSKSEGSDIVSQVSLMSNEDDDEDDQASEDDVSDMLVPISNQSKAEENLPTNEIVVGGVAKKGKRVKKNKAPISKPVISESDDDKNDSIRSKDGIDGEVKDDKVENKNREEILRHLEECIDSVVEDSRRWYEDQFGDNDDKVATPKDTSDNQTKGEETAVDDDDDDDDGDEIVVHKRVKAVKRKKGWTSFLDPKKRKVKLDKFKDEEDESTNADDNDEGKSKPSKEEERSNQSEIGEPKEKSANVSDAAKAGHEEKPETDAKEIEPDEKKEKEEKDETVEEVDGSKPAELAESPKPMDQQTKLELAKRVSQYIMKGTIDKKDRKSSSDESSNKSTSKDDQSDSRGEGERRSSVDESKACKDLKKSPGPFFNLKLMRPEDIASKLEKMSRTHIDSSRSPNVQFLLAIKNNDIVKAKTMLESGVQINMEFIDMKTGLSLVWLAVKNNLISILVLLAMHGADIEKRNRDGLTPLLYAADKGLFQTVHILCQLGVNLYTTAPDGDTAIVKAIKNRHKNVVEILLGTGIGLGDNNALAEKNLTQLAKHVGSNDVIEVINFHKARLNKELLLKASQCFESSVKIEQPVFPIQSFRMIDSKHFKISFRHELQASKKTRGMLLFIGQGQVTHNDVICSLKGKSQISRVVLNDHQLQSISDDPNFIFSFTPLVDGVNRLEINTQSLSRENFQTHLIVCAYSIELDL